MLEQTAPPNFTPTPQAMTISNQHLMINNVYELPSTQQIIRYSHVTASFPTNATWLKVSVTEVMKYFLELHKI